MNQEQLDRLEYMAIASKDAGIMLTVAPEAIIELLAYVEELQNQLIDLIPKTVDAQAEIERLRLVFAFHYNTGALSVAQVATALNMSQAEVKELTKKLPYRQKPVEEWVTGKGES